MKKVIIVFIIVSAISQSVFCQKDSTGKKMAEKIKQFWLVILKTGPKDKEITDTVARNKIFAGHFENIMRLYNDGIIKVAGPFGKNAFTWRGIFIFDCKTKEEAEKIVQSDPAVAAGLFAVEISPWYSAPIGSLVHGKPNKPE